MNAVMELDWTSANQRLLTAEFTRLRALLHDGKVAEANSQVRAMQAQLTAPASIDTLTQLFQLSTFERDILLLVAGVEMDAQLATLCGEASGRPQRPWASFGLALAALPNPHWSAIAPVQALRRWRLMEVDESTGLTSGRLKLDERVLHYIGGLNYLDHRLSPLLAEAATAGFMAEAHLTIASRATTELQNLRDRLPVVMLCGNDQHGRQDVAATVARKLGVSLYRLRAADIPATPHEQDSLAQLWQREAALLGSGLLVTYTGDDSSPAVARFITKVDGLVFTSGLKAPQIDTQSLRYEINKVEAPDQRQLWYNALGEKAESLTDALDGLSSQYRLSAHRIAGVAGQIEGKDSSRDIATLHRLCRSDDTGMNELAQSIETRATWHDLVLPEHQQRMLRQIAVHVNHRITVYHDWGFAHKSSRGLGIATLFYGESGTGKTLAAEVLANTLGLALYRIDLSTGVS